MCLYPRLIKNRKYTSNKKNGGIVPAVSDNRTLYVPIGCGECIECRKQKTREWQVRLNEDILNNINGKFITLTFSNESINKLCKHEKLTSLKGYELDNKLATLATRLFLERWRKKHKTSLRHWLVTELGHNGTENIHLHGIIWTNESYSTIEKIWSYGFIWPNKENHNKTYVSERTINYIVKYINKKDNIHSLYKSIILTSPGIGSNYINRKDHKINKFNNENTNELYRTRSGIELPLPIYYRNKIYSDKEKESLWLNKLNKNERYVCGIRVPADNTKEYYTLLEHFRAINKQLGYGDLTKNWEKEEYENKRRELMIARRIELNEHGYPKLWDEQ